jgi:hypothetical protein
MRCTSEDARNCYESRRSSIVNHGYIYADVLHGMPVSQPN